MISVTATTQATGDYTVYYYSVLEGESDYEIDSNAVERSFTLTIEPGGSCAPNLTLPTNIQDTPYSYKITSAPLSIDMTGIFNGAC